MTSRETQLVELVDDNGVAYGQTTVAEAHAAPGHLHRAFSVHLMDPTGRLLLQQRAATKTRFALRWANATCGHPAPGQSILEAAGRRLTEEVGLQHVALTEIGVYAYSAVDSETGRIENEYDHVLLGILQPENGPTRPDPAEVAALRWVEPSDLLQELRTRPEEFAPWLPGVTDIALGSMP